MSKPPQNDDDDKTLFQQYLKGTRPLQSDRRLPENTRRSTKPQARQPQPTEQGALSLRLDPDIDVNQTLFFHRGGLQHSYIKRLKRGDIAIDARLDLHGQTLDQAQGSLTQFIHHSCDSGLRCVLVVHGRGLGSENGRPLLKQAVSQWLTQLDSVIAYASAIPSHGGVGALYVILRRLR